MGVTTAPIDSPEGHEDPEVKMPPQEIVVNGATYLISEEQAASFLTDAKGEVDLISYAKELSTNSLKL